MTIKMAYYKGLLESNIKCLKNIYIRVYKLKKL